jgi:hypothetical protein
MKQRNYVARAKQSGAGKHKDKRQQLKHKEVQDEFDVRTEEREQGQTDAAMGKGSGALTDG